ncbi:stellacyanin-like [Andrographis paniculata]|uniref:stellacyanin-like n=1 Tax=Andrographis paniculata TaxID=175694 RepID=UPI0021E99957|nr:stellacyanin-like [Andrographis paniculata]
MANLVYVLLSAFLVLSCAYLCRATVHTVGDNSGWDISTDLDSWSKDKTFSVGDTLLFQYSQYHSVSEVTEEKYKGCNVTDALLSSNNGNTTVALTGPGDRYFVCGNRLHCLAGMKLHVNVVRGSLVESPAGAPEAQPGGGLPPPGTSKANGPENSAASGRVSTDSLVRVMFGAFVASSMLM